MGALITLVEFCGLFAMVKAFLEARGLGKLLVLLAYGATIAVEVVLIRGSLDDHPSATITWGFAALRVFGFGFTYMKLATN